MRRTLFTLLAALPAALAQVSSTKCPKKGVHVVAGPGMGGGPNDYGYLGSLVLSIEKAIPGSNNFCIGGYAGDNGLLQSESGEQQYRDHLTAFTRDCPQIPMVIVGYSMGAISAMNAMCGASPSPPWPASNAIWKQHNVIAMITYGDETRQNKMPYNRGTCTRKAPLHPRTTSRGCRGFFKNMQSYCDKNDIDCCTGGTNGEKAHFAYPKYDGKATHFVVQKYNQYSQEQGGNSSNKEGLPIIG